MPGSIGRGRLALRDAMGAISGPSSPFRLGASPGRNAPRRYDAGSCRRCAAGAHIAASSRSGSDDSGIKFHSNPRETCRA